jgi:hypothetical protein
MTFRGKVQDGRVIPDEPIKLPDGTKVIVELVGSPTKGVDQTTPSMYERWKDVVGIAKHLPPDASSKIDEVLYGRTDE